MSDVTVAPNATPPASNEVTINPNPTSAPQPVGSQAPDKPVGSDFRGSDHRPVSRREAIQAAFEKAQKAQNAKPADAKIGHNRPPEETKPERKAERGEPLNLRKRPTDEPARERGEHGHFVARTPDGDEYRTGAQQQARNQQQAQQQRKAPELPVTDRFRIAPQRMNDRAKADWPTVPESVRADVYRMHQEFDGAYKRYRGDHETMKTIRPFEQMAQEHGTTLHRALSNYVGMEQKLRTDVVGGLDIIVSNLNLRTPEGHKLTLRDIAWHILNQSPEQHKLMQSQNAQTAQSQQIGQLHQMVNELAQATKQMHYERQFTNTRSALDRYADDGNHPRFDELADLIEQEIKTGYDLETAYRRAELLRPATHAAQTRNTNGATTRTVDRSIHGAPAGASSNGAHRSSRDKPVGRREAIANAMKRVNGSV